MTKKRLSELGFTTKVVNDLSITMSSSAHGTCHELGLGQNTLLKAIRKTDNWVYASQNKTKKGEVKIFSFTSLKKHKYRVLFVVQDMINAHVIEILKTC